MAGEDAAADIRGEESARGQAHCSLKAAQCGETAGGGEHQACRIPAHVRAELDDVVVLHIFAAHVRAKQAAHRAAVVERQPEFLRFRVDIADVAVGATEVGAREVEVVVEVGLLAADRRDRGERERLALPVDVQRDAVVLDRIDRVLVQVGLAIERLAGRIGGARVDLAVAEQRILHERAGRAVQQVRHAAAELIELALVGDQADGGVLGGVPEQLGAQVPAVAVVQLVVVRQVDEVAVALVHRAGDAEGEGVGEGAGDLTLQDTLVVVADAGFDEAAPVEVGLLRHDADHAGRGVLTEQRALRAAQHLDALHIDEVADGAGRARAVDAVDEHTDRGLDARVVGAVTEAADDEVGVGRGLQLRHAQRRHE